MKKNNNFDIFRLLLALVVFYYHMGVLTANEILRQLPGHFAVLCFFVVSGYLIVKSFTGNPNLYTFFKARFLRIFPLYFIVVISCFAVGYINYSGSVFNYLANGGGNYLLFNSVTLNFLAPTLPDLFSNNLVDVVNGSLWTIKIEIMFYLSVPILFGFFSKYVSHLKVAFFMGFLSIVFFYFMDAIILKYNLNGSLNNQLPTFMIYFMVGAVFSFYKPRFNSAHLFMIIPLLILFWGNHIVSPFLIGSIVYILVFKVAIVPVSKKIGDLSYGIYLWHFPVIQYVYSKGFFDYFIIGFFVTSFSVFTLAWFSWHFFESRIIKKA